jgi:hypothetical protein
MASMTAAMLPLLIISIECPGFVGVGEGLDDGRQAPAVGWPDSPAHQIKPRRIGRPLIIADVGLLHRNRGMGGSALDDGECLPADGQSFPSGCLPPYWRRRCRRRFPFRSLNCLR